MIQNNISLGNPVDATVIDKLIAEKSPDQHEVRTIKTGQRIAKTRNATQALLVDAFAKNELTFAEGPAGTGKTWLAVGYAVHLLETGVVERLILSRPALEAGERLGFLPGDMKEKVDPYLRPLYDGLTDFMGFAKTGKRGLMTGMIEVAPLAFMRGRTFKNALCLLDEAQNATAMQMKMFLSRLGEGSRMIVNGTTLPRQIYPWVSSPDSRTPSTVFSHLEGVGHVRFKDSDVVRHDLVRRIVIPVTTTWPRAKS